MDAVTAFKREVVRREGIARTKEKEIVEREATVIEREKRLEQEVRTARGEYQTFLQAKDRFKADQEAWENEKARERFNGAAANREASLKSNGDSAQVDWPRSGVVANASIESPEAMRRRELIPYSGEDCEISFQLTIGDLYQIHIFHENHSSRQD